MQDHRPKLEVEGIGTWILESGKVEFIGEDDYVPSVSGNLWKYLEGGPKPKFVDPQRRFVLLDAQDEVLRGDRTGELRTVATVRRPGDWGLRRSGFISVPVPVFVFECGLVVFESDGQFRWSRDDLKLNDFFQRIENGRIFYSSERLGQWAYDLSTGELIAAE